MLFNDFKNIENPTRSQYLEVLLDDQYLKKVFKSIPEKFLDQEFYEEAVRSNPKTLGLIPEKFKTKEFYLVLVVATHSLNLVPAKIKDYDFLIKAVGLVPLVISEVENKTYEMCVIALKESPQLYDRVPANLRSFDLVLEVVKNAECIIKYVPPENINEEISEIAIKKSGWLLEFVPHKYRSYDLCLKAVNENFSALAHVPFELIDKKMVDLALSQHTRSLRVVPKEWQSPEMCLDVIAKDSACYNFVKICDNSNLEKTIENLKAVINKEIVQRTIRGLSD